MEPWITITNARLHNLKNITVRIPKGKLVAMTGISGSGKSTLAFDILQQEGVRQYMEAIGMLPFGATAPPVDAISGLSPTVSVDQFLTNHSPRSTVGTVTEIFTYLRLLYARLGHRPCPACGAEVLPLPDGAASAWESDAPDEAGGESVAATTPCPHCGAPLPALNMGSFSFNKPEGACPTCTGLGVVRQANIGRLVNQDRSIEAGAVLGWDLPNIKRHVATLQAAGNYYGFAFDPTLPIKDFPPAQRDLLFYGAASPQFQRHFPQREPPATVNRGRFEGVANTMLRRYAEHIQDADYLQKMADLVVTDVCPDCAGTRLRAERRAVTVAGETIIALAALPLSDLALWVDRLPDTLSAEEHAIASSALIDLSARIARVRDVGVDYLTLERAATSLSAGEAQRLRLASLLGSSLTGLLYIFDEPTIGLHPRDTNRLIAVMRRLRDLGNTVLVVEHDRDVIRAADYVVDVGPGAGKGGGQIVAAGTPAEIARIQDSLTGAYLAGRLALPAPQQRRARTAQALTIQGAREHNLRDVTVDVPLGMLVAVTGVSGSGKSTLIFDILAKAGRRRFNGASDAPGAHAAIHGWDHCGGVIIIDQEHIGRAARSNVATYADVFTPIREAFAATDAARQRRLTAGHFSFNIPGGRCDRCEGMGTLTVNMHFLPDTEVTCPACQGRRFKPETLAMTYRDHDIAQVLDLTVAEALPLFQDIPAAAARLRALADVGLGYVPLGQPGATLSGGEAQRVKLAKELGRRGGGRALYLLDEPTTGLHAADTAKLLALLQRLVDAGNSVVVVEHNLDVIAAADWIIDLGPEGGAAGGRVIAAGAPETVAQVAASHTSAFLRGML